MINPWGIPLNAHKVRWNNMRLFFCENQRAEKRAHWCLSHPRFSMLSMQSWSGSPRCQAEACAFYLLGPWIQATNHQLSVKMMGVNSQTNSCPTDMERKIIGWEPSPSQSLQIDLAFASSWQCWTAQHMGHRGVRQSRVAMAIAVLKVQEAKSWTKVLTFHKFASWKWCASSKITFRSITALWVIPTVRVDEIKGCFHLLDLGLSWHEAVRRIHPV